MKEPTLLQLLRDPGAYISGPSDATKMCQDAADEIERLMTALRAISDKSRTEIDCSPGQLAKIADEVLRPYQQYERNNER